MHYFLNIGSNLGQRKLNISRALRALEKKFGYFETSHIIESRPWGYVSDNMFLNIGVMIVSDLTPIELLDVLQSIERDLNSAHHRDSEGNYADREVDIDIIAADEKKLETDRLTVPHRCLSERRFFLEPMKELAPLWRHPDTGLTCTEMLAALPSEDIS